MSLGRLLTSGKSLIGLHGTSGRYEMRRKNLLPKFGSPSNPFNSAAPASASQTADGKFQAVRRTLNEGEQQAAELKETRRLPVVKAIKGFEELERTRVRETGQVVSRDEGCGETARGDARPTEGNGAAVSAMASLDQGCGTTARGDARPTEGNGAAVRSTGNRGVRRAVAWVTGFVRSLNPVGWWRRWRARGAAGRPGRAPVQTELSLDNIKVVRNDLNDAESAPVRVAVTPAMEEPQPAQPVDETPELIKV